MQKQAEGVRPGRPLKCGIELADRSPVAPTYRVQIPNLAHKLCLRQSDPARLADERHRCLVEPKLFKRDRDSFASIWMS